MSERNDLTCHGRPVVVVDTRWGSWTRDALIRYLDGNRELVIVHAGDIENNDPEVAE